MNVARQPIVILVADDDEEDQMITRETFEDRRLANELRFVKNGEEVMQYLQRQGKFAEPWTSPRPGLILLDLNLPKRDGREVLKVVKGHATMKTIPVVVVSTSDREEDVTSALERGAVAYISKSSGFDSFNEQIAAVHTYALQRG